MVNPLTLYWGLPDSDAVAIAAHVQIGSASTVDESFIRLIVRAFRNTEKVVQDYTFDLGTVGAPTIGIYKPTWIAIN